jgi:hypothetical protein
MEMGREMKTETELEQLIAERWAYVVELLCVHGESTPNIERCAFHFKTAFQQGYLAAKENAGLLTKAAACKAIDEEQINWGGYNDTVDIMAGPPAVDLRWER